jgi:hypothetical protein
MSYTLSSSLFKYRLIKFPPNTNTRIFKRSHFLSHISKVYRPPPITTLTEQYGLFFLRTETRRKAILSPGVMFSLTEHISEHTDTRNTF